MDRLFAPAHYNDYTTMECTHTTSTGACTTQVPVYHHDFQPDVYVLVLADGAGDHHRVEVSKDSYEQRPTAWTHQHLRWSKCGDGKDW